jgi:hypothetical protein
MGTCHSVYSPLLNSCVRSRKQGSGRSVVMSAARPLQGAVGRYFHALASSAFT